MKQRGKKIQASFVAAPQTTQLGPGTRLSAFLHAITRSVSFTAAQGGQVQ